MDPQQRMLLETGDRALDAAGQNCAVLSGTGTGVALLNIYALGLGAISERTPLAAGAYAKTGVSLSVAMRVTLVVDHGGCAAALLHLCPGAAAVLRVGGLLVRDGPARAVLLGPAAQVRLCDGRPNSRALAARSQLGSPDLFFLPAAMTSARRHSHNSAASSARCSLLGRRRQTSRLAPSYINAPTARTDRSMPTRLS